jgi:hypothetical protein
MAVKKVPARSTGPSGSARRVVDLDDPEIVRARKVVERVERSLERDRQRVDTARARVTAAATPDRKRDARERLAAAVETRRETTAVLREARASLKALLTAARDEVRWAERKAKAKSAWMARANREFERHWAKKLKDAGR